MRVVRRVEVPQPSRVGGVLGPHQLAVWLRTSGPLTGRTHWQGRSLSADLPVGCYRPGEVRSECLPGAWRGRLGRLGNFSSSARRARRNRRSPAGSAQ